MSLQSSRHCSLLSHKELVENNLDWNLNLNFLEKKAVYTAFIIIEWIFWVWDSNPRARKGLPDLESGAFDHSANSPLCTKQKPCQFLDVWQNVRNWFLILYHKLSKWFAYVIDFENSENCIRLYSNFSKCSWRVLPSETYIWEAREERWLMHYSKYLK